MLSYALYHCAAQFENRQLQFARWNYANGSRQYRSLKTTRRTNQPFALLGYNCPPSRHVHVPLIFVALLFTICFLCVALSLSLAFSLALYISFVYFLKFIRILQFAKSFESAEMRSEVDCCAAITAALLRTDGLLTLGYVLYTIYWSSECCALGKMKVTTAEMVFTFHFHINA